MGFSLNPANWGWVKSIMRWIRILLLTLLAYFITSQRTADGAGALIVGGAVLVTSFFVVRT